MSDTSQQAMRSGVTGRIVGLSAALLLGLAACGEPASEGGDQQQQGSVAPQSDQSSTMLTGEDTGNTAAEQKSNQ